MHPEVCSFISGAVYEDQLYCHPDTSKRLLVLSEKPLRYIDRESGIIYIPVEHEGNCQESAEETIVIADIVKELESCGMNYPDIL